MSANCFSFEEGRQPLPGLHLWTPLGDFRPPDSLVYSPPQMKIAVAATVEEHRPNNTKRPLNLYVYRLIQKGAN